MFDIPGQIRKALIDFFAWMVKSALNPVLGALGRTLLSTPDLTANEQVKTIWTVSLVTANGIFALFLLAGAFTIASHQSLQSSYGFKQVAPRLAAGAVLANVSLLVCGKFIALANATCASVAGQGVDPHAAAEAIIQALTGAVRGSNFLMTLLVLGALVMAIVALITFILRIVFLVILIGVAPLALICHALPQTESLAYTWWRAIAACFGIQLGQAVILLASVRVFLNPKDMTVLGLPVGPDALMGVLVCLTMLWLLIKLPGWMRQFVLGPLGQRGGRGLFGQILHTYLTLKTLGAAAGILSGAGAARTAATATRRPPGPGTGRTTARATPPRPPRPPRPGSARPTPTPTGPVAFSHAPVTHTPLAQPAGSNSAPSFSHPSAPATPQSASSGVAPAQFSHPTPPQPATPTPSQRPTPVRFSAASTTATATSRTNPGAGTPPVVFSSASAQHTAPKRPPAPFTPVFSSAPSALSWPTAARRAPTPSPRPVPGPTALSVPTTRSVPVPTTRSVPVPTARSVPTPRAVHSPRPVPTPRPVPSPRPVPTPPPVPIPTPPPVPPARPVAAPRPGAVTPPPQPVRRAATGRPAAPVMPVFSSAPAPPSEEQPPPSRPAARPPRRRADRSDR